MIDEKILEDIFKHAEECYPNECCGYILQKEGESYYKPGRNIHPHKNTDFKIRGRDYRDEDGKIIMVVHSHCNAKPEPSQADLINCEKSGLPWIIVSWPMKKVKEFSPCGYKAELIGRKFVYGIADCLSLVRDHHARELGIDFPDFERPAWEWWKKDGDFFMDKFEEAGFVRTDKLEKNSIILMTLASRVINHAAIYLGDSMILHHLCDALSGRDIYGGYWEKNTRIIVRHKEL